MVHGWLDALSGNAVFVGLELLIVGVAIATVANLLGSRARTLVHAWATHGGWEVVRCRRCLFVAGGQIVLPGLPVFHLTLRSRSGRERTAFVRVGNLMLGALSDELAIQWVESAGR